MPQNTDVRFGHGIGRPRSGPNPGGLVGAADADAHIGQDVVSGREIGFGQRDICCPGVLLDAAGTATDGTHP